MGHTRLGNIPKTRNWQAVVDAFVSDVDENEPNLEAKVFLIAGKTLEAIDEGLDVAGRDYGLNYIYSMMIRMVLASREKDWQSSFESIGLKVNYDTTFYDLVADFQEKIESELHYNYCNTDVSENAQKAAIEALTKLVLPESSSLFDSGIDDLLSGLKRCSTKKGIGELSKTFFGAFLSKHLNFYLSRITAASIGNSAIEHLGDITSFNRILENHCYQSASIIRDFAGIWVKKTEYEEGVNNKNTRSFISGAIKKLKDEMRLQGKEAQL